MKTVYLAGPIAGRTDSECVEWRQTATRILSSAGILCLNPMVRDYRDAYDGRTSIYYYKEVVELDKRDIRDSDSLLVYHDVPSVGTSMEVLYAWTLEKPIVVVSPPELILSPWMLYHSTWISHKLSDGIDKIIEYAGGIQ